VKTDGINPLFVLLVETLEGALIARQGGLSEGALLLNEPPAGWRGGGPLVTLRPGRKWIRMGRMTVG
jgi:hypothetical protein